MAACVTLGNDACLDHLSNGLYLLQKPCSSWIFCTAFQLSGLARSEWCNAWPQAQL